MSILKLLKISFILFLCLPLTLLAHEKHQTSKKAPAVSTGNLKLGAWKFESCFYCHSLKPDVHLTGPSLANLFGQPAAQVKGYELYSDAMKKSAIVWNEESLNKFLFNPQNVVSGTSMTFKGFREKKGVQQLVDFLKVAMGPNGYQKVLDDKLLEARIAGGQLPEDLSTVSDDEIVTTVEHCGENYKITTKDGAVNKHWQMNVEFKVSSGSYGPPKGKPAIMTTGSLGDRFVIVFRDTEDMKAIVKSCGSK